MERTPQKSFFADFNHCKWAKGIVAIAALPLIAMIAASLFDPVLLRLVAAVAAVIVALLVARWIDAIPFLQAKVCKAKSAD